MSEKVDIKRKHRRRSSPSLFGPVILIAIGTYFLLDNLNMLPPLNWEAALNLWPLALIFLGLNVIVRQAPRPFGSLLSLLVAITAVGGLSYVLLNGAGDLPGGIQLPERELQRTAVSFPATDVEQARVEIDFNQFPARLEALELDSATSDGALQHNLIQGEVVHLGNIVFEAEPAAGGATVTLDSDGQNVGLRFPGEWIGNDSEEWTVGLHPGVDLDLRLDIDSGAVDLDLAGLSLSKLEIDGSSGSTDLSLPPGTYDVMYDAGSGSVEISLPAEGRPSVELEGSSGSITFYLPETVEAQIEVVDDGSGSFDPGPRFTRVEQTGSDHEGLWETDGYNSAGDRVTIRLEIGSGSVSVERLVMTGR